MMTKMHVYYEGNFRTRCVGHDGKNEIKTDAPKDRGGKGEFFSPTDLLAVALGTCVLTVMGLAADQLKVDITGIRLEVEKTTTMTIHIYCPRSFDAETQHKLELAGSRCPVHQSLHPNLKQEFFFHWGEA